MQEKQKDCKIVSGSACVNRMRHTGILGRFVDNIYGHGLLWHQSVRIRCPCRHSSTRMDFIRTTTMAIGLLISLSSSVGARLLNPASG